MQQGNEKQPLDANGRPSSNSADSDDSTDSAQREIKRLQDLANRYSVAAQAANQVLYDWDAKTNVVFYGGALETMLGYSQDEMKGGLDRWRELIHPSDISNFDALIKHVIETGDSAVLHYRVQRSDGSYISIEDRGEFFLDSEGNLLRMAGFVSDVSDALRTAVRLQDAEEIAGLGSWEWDISSGKISWSEQMYVIHGLNRNEFRETLEHIVSFIHPDDLERFNKNSSQVSDTGITPTLVYRIVRNDGEVRHVEGHARFTGGTYEQSDTCQGTLRDITDQVVGEKHLRDDEQRMRLILDSTADGIITIKQSGEILEFNNSATRIFGIEASEAIGTNVSRLVPAVHTAKHDQYIADYMETGKSNVVGRTREVSAMYSSGKEFPALLTVKRAVDQGEVVFIATVQDLTEQKRLESELLQAKKMESIGRLAGGIAHDFNNLLMVISGFSEVAAAKSLKKQAVQKELHNIISAGKKGALLTQQLMAFARKQIIQPRVVNVNNMISDMMPMFTTLAGETIQITTRLSDEQLNVLMDPSQYNQLLMNLVANARDAMPDGGHLTIITESNEHDTRPEGWREHFEPGEYVCTKILDTGSGIAADDLQKIFEPFYTTKEAGAGTGLGLATCYGIVKQNHGNITATSRDGAGTIFSICLPRSHSQISAEPKATAKIERPTGSETILLVEDDELVREVTAAQLQALGYEVLEARSGINALSLLESNENNIHLLMTDVVMPQMSGRELIDRVKRFREDLHVLYVSGHTEEAIDKHGMIEDGVAFLQKPFSSTTLAAKLREILD